VRHTRTVGDDLGPGIYESILDQRLESLLAQVDERLVDTRTLRSADAADRIAQYVAQHLRRALSSVPDSERVELGVTLARRLLNDVADTIPRGGVSESSPLDPGRMLHGIGNWRPDGSVRMPRGPLIPRLDPTLLTNSPGEPHVGGQVATEIGSADSIDIVMAFVRRSGLRPMMEGLREHCQQGKPLRVLTTTYTFPTTLRRLDCTLRRGYSIDDQRSPQLMLARRT
jgi:hypothetical protein